MTTEMKNKIIEFIQTCNNMYSSYGDKAKCVSNRMTDTYNKNNWSCLVGEKYGLFHPVKNNLSYKYKYNNIDWIVYLGAY